MMKLINIYFFLGLVIIDSPYGLDKFEGDSEEWDLSQWSSVLQTAGVESSDTGCLVVFFNFWSAGVVKEAILKSQYWGVPIYCIWHKENAYNTGGYRLVNSCESFLICHKKGENNRSYWSFESAATSRDNCFIFNSPTAPELQIDPTTGHPYLRCQKPVQLYFDIFSKLAPPIESILDLGIGTGTAEIAAILCGRNVIGFEKDPTMIACASARILKLDAKLKQQFKEGIFEDLVSSWLALENPSVLKEAEEAKSEMEVSSEEEANYVSCSKCSHPAADYPCWKCQKEFCTTHATLLPALDDTSPEVFCCDDCVTD